MRFLSQTTGAVVGYNQLTSDSSFFDFTPKAIILTTTAPVYADRLYQILVSGEIEGTSGPFTAQSEIRITTDGSSVTTTSTQIGRGLSYNDNGIPVPVVISVMYPTSSDHTLKVGVVSFRPVPNTNPGGPDVRWTAASDRPMTLAVIDCGPKTSPAS